MKKFAILAVVPLFAGYLYAQAEQTTHTESTTKTTSWNGTLVDANCRASHTEHHESSTTNEGGATTRTESSHSETVDCPVTETTTSFGLVTPDGRYVHFDQPSNTRVVEVVRSKKWDKFLKKHEPVKVNVVGSENGDTVVVESIR